MISRVTPKEFKADGVDKSYDEIFLRIWSNMDIQF